MSVESKAKLLKHLKSREILINDFYNYLNHSIAQIKQITISYEKPSRDILSSLQYFVKRAYINNTIQKIKYYNEMLIEKSNVLSFDIKQYFTQDILVEQTYGLNNVNVKTK
jgi:hypothetical protein